MAQNQANCHEFPRIAANSSQFWAENLALFDQVMMQTGVPPYDARRTLLTTGIFDYVMVARGEGPGCRYRVPDCTL